MPIVLDKVSPGKATKDCQSVQGVRQSAFCSLYNTHMKNEVGKKPRVTSGSAKGKKLETPNIPDFRATQDVVKLAVFSILGEKTIGGECLDLFAGAGSFGIEALSRGAAHCDFVDDSNEANKTIEKNLVSCGFSQKGRVYREHAVSFVSNTLTKYDVVFMDPFFADTAHKFLFKNLPQIVKTGAIVIYTHNPDTAVENLIAGGPFEVYTQRKFGKTLVSILSAKEDAQHIDHL